MIRSQTSDWSNPAVSPGLTSPNYCWGTNLRTPSGPAATTPHQQAGYMDASDSASHEPIRIVVIWVLVGSVFNELGPFCDLFAALRAFYCFSRRQIVEHADRLIECCEIMLIQHAVDQLGGHLGLDASVRWWPLISILPKTCDHRRCWCQMPAFLDHWQVELFCRKASPSSRNAHFRGTFQARHQAERLCHWPWCPASAGTAHCGTSDRRHRYSELPAFAVQAPWGEHRIARPS